MRKILALNLVGALLLPTFVFAAFDDVTLTTDAVISIGGYTLNVSGSSAVVESIVVSADSFSVTLGSGSSITVSSLALNRLASDIETYVTDNTCTGTASSITLSYSGAGTVTNVITPSATICSTAAPSGSSGSVPGGGAVIGCTDRKALNYSPLAYGTNTAPCQYVQISNISSVTAIPTSAETFEDNFTSGMSDYGVRTLQQFLNARGYLVAKSGPGSPGAETEYFGPATMRALAAFQTASGISPAAGYFGPLTRTFINGMNNADIVSSSNSSLGTEVFAVSFVRNLASGMQGGDVIALQALLITNGFEISAGATGYFGAQTKAALAAYQASVGISPAAGYFGPITRSFVAAAGEPY